MVQNAPLKLKHTRVVDIQMKLWNYYGMTTELPFCGKNWKLSREFPSIASNSSSISVAAVQVKRG